jgi:hypothetical protein
MTITDAVIVASIAAVPTTIVGVATLITSIRAKKSTEEKLGVVHELVNSRLTAALNKIDLLEAKLQTLTGHAPTGEPPPDASMDKPTDLIPRRNDPQKPESGERHD